jgi:septal ring factor EnvC (AmiA/AmiB activator)
MAARKGNGSRVDLSTRILTQIRDEMRAMRQEQHATNQRLDVTNQRLDRLEKRQTEDSVRLASEVVALARAVGEVRDLSATSASIARAWTITSSA